MSEHRSDFPQFYITTAQPCPYLPGRQERKLFTHLSHGRSASLIDHLLKGGFRRSQNIAYTPHCDGCNACVPVRIVVDEFEPRRAFKRVLRTNNDLTIRRSGPVPTSEQYSIFRAYIDQRHGDGGMADMSVLDYAVMIEESVVDTFVSEYRIPREREKATLAAVSLCDRLSDGLSLVYSFFEPDLTARSLGTYMILEHVDYARTLGLPYVYLGYWINGATKMDYKIRFQPLEFLTRNGWERREAPV
ncbi:MAG: arginyltransferase [Proteobacteria bacterium]|nr:arginyltransferase [Pseudomonadota bacterium]